MKYNLIFKNKKNHKYSSTFFPLGMDKVHCIAMDTAIDVSQCIDSMPETSAALTELSRVCSSMQIRIIIIIIIINECSRLFIIYYVVL